MKPKDTDCKPKSQTRQGRASANISDSSKQITNGAVSKTSEVYNSDCKECKATNGSCKVVKTEDLSTFDPDLSFSVTLAATLAETTRVTIYSNIKNNTLKTVPNTEPVLIYASSLFNPPFKKHSIAKTNYSLKQRELEQQQSSHFSKLSKVVQGLPLDESDRDRDTPTYADAWLWHVKRFRQCLEDLRQGVKKELEAYCDLVSDGSMEAPDWALALIPRLTYKSLKTALLV